jgi:hypothetical protein
MMLSSQCKALFLLLILAQVAHSLEEYTFRLYDVLAPARFISSLASDDPATGFAIVNTIFVLVGAWCYIFPVRRDYASAPFVVWVWVVVEFANAVVHLLLALMQGGYFPGAFTAVPLLALSAVLGKKLAQHQ